MDYKSKNRYYSATLSRLLSHTRQQKTTADLRIAKSTSHYYFGGSELLVMRKQNPSWEFTLNHQHYFNKRLLMPASASSAACRGSARQQRRKSRPGCIARCRGLCMVICRQ